LCLFRGHIFGQPAYFARFILTPFHWAVDLTELLQFTRLMVDFKNTMWCRQCQQDVPAVASSGERKYCCPRCGQAVGSQGPAETGAKTPSPDLPAISTRVEETPYCDNWELDDQLMHIGQVLQVDKAQNRGREKAYQHEVARLDPAHNAMGSRHVPPTPALRGRKSKSRGTDGGGSFLSALIWMVLSLGTAALVCGGMLLGWSLIAGRNELWNIGLPIAAGGQIALLIGLVLQLDRFWHDNHHTVSKLDEVDEKLHDLKTTAALLDTVHGPSSTAFYTHLAGGANSQLLLSDLKSQLDILAMKIGEQE
jgi:hypothetical protein